MKTIVLILCSAVMLSAADAPLAPLPMAPENRQEILSAMPDSQQLNFLNQIVEAQKQRIMWLATELARIKTCWAAGVPEKQCGGLTPDGKAVIRLPEPAKIPAAK